MKQCEKEKRRLLLSGMEPRRIASNFFSWREAAIEKMPYSVIEIESTVEDDKKIYFQSFFFAFGPCLQDFREGYMSYLSVDSTTLNG
jgi:hypothetical protein